MCADHAAALLRGGWNTQEEALLFETADRARTEGKPLKFVFEEVAAATGRRPNSIRNYYYARIKEDDERIRTLGQNAAFVPFTEEEIESLLRTVLQEQAKGISVRACTLAMGNGDNKLMLRYQNKYRALVKSNPQLVKKVISEMQMEGAEVFDPYEQQKTSRKAGRPRKHAEGLVETISGVVSDLYRVEGLDVISFFESLGTLAVGAVKGADAIAKLNVYEREISNTTDTIALGNENTSLRAELQKCEQELSAQAMRLSEIQDLLRALAEVNREFLNKSSVEKMGTLAGYLQDLTTPLEAAEQALKGASLPC